MKQPLSMDAINAMAPYTVSLSPKTGFYHFTSDYGVELAIDFMMDDLLTTAESYQLVISNVNNRKSPRDKKVQMTILAIVCQFMEANQSALLYICETGDGKQMARDRLFHFWFDTCEYRIRFTYMQTSIVDQDGITNAATLIVRNDNQHLTCLITEFAEITDLLRNKPETVTTANHKQID